MMLLDSSLPTKNCHQYPCAFNFSFGEFNLSQVNESSVLLGNLALYKNNIPITIHWRENYSSYSNYTQLATSLSKLWIDPCRLYTKARLHTGSHMLMAPMFSKITSTFMKLSNLKVGGASAPPPPPPPPPGSDPGLYWEMSVTLLTIKDCMFCEYHYNGLDI